MLPTVEALNADKGGQTEYYLMLKTYHCIKINPFAINEIGSINLFVEKCQIVKKSLIISPVRISIFQLHTKGKKLNWRNRKISEN